MGYYQLSKCWLPAHSEGTTGKRLGKVFHPGFGNTSTASLGEALTTAMAIWNALEL